MAFAREIIQRILQNVRFRVPKTGEKDSYYTIIGNSMVRISNHCTYMYVWDNYLEKNPKCNNMNIVSIVFEDNDDTFHQNCLVLNRDRKKPIVAEEFVYPLHGNANFLTKDEVKNIIKSLKAIGTTNKFKEVTSKGIVNKRISINPTSQNVSVDIYGNNVYTTDNEPGVDFISESIYNSKEIKENRNMNKKQTIRINENQLRQIVTESVKKVLKENYMPWTKDDFYEFVYNYLDAQNVHNGLLIDTPFGDLNYKFSDEKTTLYIWFDSEEECSKLNDYVDADDVYDISYYGNCAFVRLIDD